MIVLPNLVDQTAFFPDPKGGMRFRARYGIPRKAVVFCRVGQPHEANWSPVLIDVFRRVHDRMPGARLVLVGASHSVARKVESLPVSAREAVLLLQTESDDARLREVYSGSDIFVHLASGGESFGMVLAEAMLCQCAPITLSTPAYHNSQIEVVGHGKGGLVCATVAGVEEAMIALGENTALRKQLAEAGRRSVIERFTADRVMSRLQAAIKTSRSDRGARPIDESIRDCRAMYATTWDGYSVLVSHWLRWRHYLTRIQACDIGDRVWRAIAKVISRFEWGWRPTRQDGGRAASIDSTTALQSGQSAAPTAVFR